MIDLKVLFAIRKEAIQSIRMDSDGKIVNGNIRNLSFLLLWYLLPIAGVIVAIYKNVELSKLENYIGASVAIFTGLFFSLLLGLGDKLRTEKANENIDIKNYNKFKENLKQISKITQFVILTGVLVFVLLLLNSLLKETHPYVEKTLSCITIYLLIQYTISIWFLLQRFHFVLKDELNNTI